MRRVDTIAVSDGLQRLLGFVNFPVAAEKARVFVAVGVAQHHLL
jgi:hypothetical protein